MPMGWLTTITNNNERKGEKLKQNYIDIELNITLTEPQKKSEKLILATENNNNKLQLRQYLINIFF